MVGQFTNRRGYTRNFAYRYTRPVLITEDKIIELNPAGPATIVNDRLIVRAKVQASIDRVNNHLIQIADEIAAGIFAEKHFLPISEGHYQGGLHA
jgi:hypothetical protein